MQGLVIRSTGSWYDVRTQNGSAVRCRLRGKFKMAGFKVTNPIAVGDRVIYEIESETEQLFGIINEILPRENYIIRKSVHKAEQGHLLATNIDQAVLIATLHSPRTSLGFIDRFLVTAESFRIPTVIVFNKTDLLNEDDLELQHAIAYLYKNAGYESLFTSAETQEGMDAFEALLQNKITLISGHSGVGKSSLVNRINPDLDLRTNEISTFANKGVHTTTFAEMFEIAKDTFIIDSPGIKELGLMDIEKAELSHYFPEMRVLLNDCKFNNCQHVNEPKCAVKEALETGKVTESRYMSYLSMLEGDDNRR